MDSKRYLDSKRYRHTFWSAFWGGTLGGVITAQVVALFSARGSFGISPWLYGALLLTCIAAVAWIGHERLQRYLRPTAFAMTVGGTAGVWIALLLLSPPVNRYAIIEPFVLDFILLATLVGLIFGTATGALVGLCLVILRGEVTEMLLQWLWLLGGVIALAGLVGVLLGANTRFWLAPSPLIVAGGMLAGWIAQIEYRRLSTVQAIVQEQSKE